LAEQGVDQNLGARPLKRVIQKLVLDPLSMKIITGSAKPGTKITIDAQDKEIVFKDSRAIARRRDKVLV
jgi:ATP-dependent Clp protease ATP-binding subunit ClpA